MRLDAGILRVIFERRERAILGARQRKAGVAL